MKIYLINDEEKHVRQHLDVEEIKVRIETALQARRLGAKIREGKPIGFRPAVGPRTRSYSNKYKQR